jgi:hypothetical protein
VSKSRSTAGGRKTLLGGAESKYSNNGISANGGEIYQAPSLEPTVSSQQFLFACSSYSFIRPEHPFFPELLAEIGHRGPRATVHYGGQHGPYRVGAAGTEALATQAIAAEALATEESLATEALAMHRSRWPQRYRQWRRNSRGNSAPCSSLALSRLAGPITTT